MQIQALAHEDIGLLSDLQPEGWNNLETSFLFYVESAFCFPIKIVVNGLIVGLGATIIHKDVAWLGHIIVRAGQRGMGIGKLLTQSLIDIASQHHCETIYLIATELGFPVYEKLGFVTDTEYLSFKDLNFEEKLEVSDQIIAYQQGFKTEISILDKIVSGEDRMMHLEEALVNGFVYVHHDKIEGYYLPALGDGLIVANHSTAGLELLKLHLKSNDKANFPVANLTAADFLYKNGFKECDVLKHMRLGPIRPFKLENIYNRIGGNVG